MRKTSSSLLSAIVQITPFLIISWTVGCTLPPPPPPASTPPHKKGTGQPEYPRQPQPEPHPDSRQHQGRQPFNQPAPPPPPPARPQQPTPPPQASRPKRPAPAPKVAPRPKPQSDQQPRIDTPNGATQFATGYIVQRFGAEALKAMLPLQAQLDGNGVWVVHGARPPQPDQKVSELRIDSRTARVLSVK